GRVTVRHVPIRRSLEQIVELLGPDVGGAQHYGVRQKPPEDGRIVGSQPGDAIFFGLEDKALEAQAFAVGFGTGYGAGRHGRRGPGDNGGAEEKTADDRSALMGDKGAKGQNPQEYCRGIPEMPRSFRILAEIAAADELVVDGILNGCQRLLEVV